jgi:hypothetical protein
MTCLCHHLHPIPICRPKQTATCRSVPQFPILCPSAPNPLVTHPCAPKGNQWMRNTDNLWTPLPDPNSVTSGPMPLTFLPFIISLVFMKIDLTTLALHHLLHDLLTNTDDPLSSHQNQLTDAARTGCSPHRNTTHQPGFPSRPRVCSPAFHGAPDGSASHRHHQPAVEYRNAMPALAWRPSSLQPPPTEDRQLVPRYDGAPWHHMTRDPSIDTVHIDALAFHAQGSPGSHERVSIASATNSPRKDRGISWRRVPPGLPRVSSTLQTSLATAVQAVLLTLVVASTFNTAAAAMHHETQDAHLTLFEDLGGMLPDAAYIHVLVPVDLRNFSSMFSAANDLLYHHINYFRNSPTYQYAIWHDPTYDAALYLSLHPERNGTHTIQVGISIYHQIQEISRTFNNVTAMLPANSPYSDSELKPQSRQRWSLLDFLVSPLSPSLALSSVHILDHAARLRSMLSHFCKTMSKTLHQIHM